MLDTSGKLGLVRNLPSLKLLEEVKEQGRKVLGKLMRDFGKRLSFGTEKRIADTLKALDQRHSCVIERLLQSAHVLENMSRTVSNHEASKEDPNVNIGRNQCSRRRTMTKGTKVMDALKASLGNLDDVFVTQLNHKRLEGDALGMLFSSTMSLHELHQILGSTIEGLDLNNLQINVLVDG